MNGWSIFDQPSPLFRPSRRVKNFGTAFAREKAHASPRWSWQPYHTNRKGNGKWRTTIASTADSGSRRSTVSLPRLVRVTRMATIAAGTNFTRAMKNRSTPANTAGNVLRRSADSRRRPVRAIRTAITRADTLPRCKRQNDAKNPLPRLPRRRYEMFRPAARRFRGKATAPGLKSGRNRCILYKSLRNGFFQH